MNVVAKASALREPSSFLEYHYYKGGLRIEHFSLAGSRPSWAPPPEWVGFRDETSLQGDDVAVEVVKFDHPDGVACWIGLYRHSPDHVYGDRKNHIGIGVWLFDQFPSNPELLVESLEALLKLYSDSEPGDFKRAAEAYLQEYLIGYVSPFRQLSAPMGGLRLANNQVLSTTLLHVYRQSKSFARELEDSFFRLFFLSPTSENENRALILLTNSPSTAVSPPTGSARTFTQEFLAQIPLAFKNQSELLNQLQNKLSVSEGTIVDLDKRVDELQNELKSALERAAAAEERYDVLQATLAEDDELKRFSILHDGVSSLQSQFSSFSREMFSLRRELLADLRRELQAVSGRSMVVHQPRDVAPERSREVSPPDYEIDWELVLCLLLIISALGSLVFQYFS